MGPLTMREDGGFRKKSGDDGTAFPSSLACSLKLRPYLLRLSQVSVAIVRMLPVIPTNRHDLSR